MKVSVGSRVEIELLDQNGETARLVFDIVPDQVADFASGLLGANTPLARAILGQEEGALIPYSMADVRAVHILSIAPGLLQTAGATAATRRRAEAERAVRDVDRTSAIVFASSFSGKWGDYDPSGIEKWEEQADNKKQNHEQAQAS